MPWITHKTHLKWERAVRLTDRLFTDCRKLQKREANAIHRNNWNPGSEMWI